MCTPQNPQSCSSASCRTPEPIDIKSQVTTSPRTLLNLALQVQKTSHPAALNFIPCTAYDYSQLCDSIEDTYELLNGLLLSKETPNRKHLEIQAFLNHVILMGHATGKFNIVVYIEPIVNFVNPFEVTDVQASPSRDTEGKNSRIADVAIGEYVDRETRHDYSPNSRKNPFSIKRLPRVVIEVTSPSNYKNDVNDKWKQYAKYKVPEYYIIDCQRQCVVRGYLGSGPRHRSGDWKDDRRLHPKEKSDQTYYCRDIFTGDQLIQGKYLGKLNITANDVLNPQHLPDWLRELEEKSKETEEERKKEMAMYRKEREEAKKKIEDYKNLTRNLIKDIDEAKMEAQVEREKRKTETKKRKDLDAKLEAKLEEKEAKIRKLEAELAEFRKTLTDPSIADSVLARVHEAGNR